MPELVGPPEWRDPDSNRGHHDFQLCGRRRRERRNPWRVRNLRPSVDRRASISFRCDPMFGRDVPRCSATWSGWRRAAHAARHRRRGPTRTGPSTEQSLAWHSDTNAWQYQRTSLLEQGEIRCEPPPRLTRESSEPVLGRLAARSSSRAGVSSAPVETPATPWRLSRKSVGTRAAVGESDDSMAAGAFRPRSGSCGRQGVAVELLEVVGGRDQAPFGAHGRPTSSVKPAHPAVVLGVSEHRLDRL